MAIGHEQWTERQKTATVEVDDHDVEMAYYEGGGEGVPVVFLHGIPTWSYLWRHVVAELEDGDRRVIAPDMVGYGNSEKRDGFDRSLRAQEDALLDLLGQLGVEEFDFVAHDLGGGVALRVAWHTDRVRKLVLSNAVMYDSWPVEFVTDLGLPGNINDMSVEDLTGLLDAAFRQTLIEPDDEFVEAMKSRYATDEGRISLSRNAVSTNTTHTTEIDYDEVEAETLCVWGKDDGFQPIEYARRLDDELTNSAGVVGLEGRHWVPEDRSDDYPERVVEFLES